MLNINFDKIKNMFKKTTFITVAAVFAIFLVIKSITIIPAGETGVYHLFGKVRNTELKSGLHIINPFASVTKMSIRTEQYTMSSARDEGQKIGDDSISALTKEGLMVKLDLTVFYHLEEEKASDVYRELGKYYQEKIIRPEIRSAIREIVTRYEAKEIYSEKRDEVANKISERLKTSIEPRGITIESVLLRNVILPSSLAKSIENKLQAEQEAQRMDFVLEKERKEANRKRIEAEGQRDAQRIISESLTKEYLNYMYIKELKDRKGTIYVPISSETGMPLFKNIQ